jgi:D-galactose 1-dehydrogenase
MVEMPPGDPARLDSLAVLAKEKGVTLFTGYHSAGCPGMHWILKWLQGNKVQQIKDIKFTWKESVAKSHRGQDWVTQKDGGGVMDLLFNPISLLVCAVEEIEMTLDYKSAEQDMTGNWTAPISGKVKLAAKNKYGAIKVYVSGDFSWRYEPTDGSPQEV